MTGLAPIPGRRVKIERDEERYPRGRPSWERIRGAIATIISVNTDEDELFVRVPGRGEVWLLSHEYGEVMKAKDEK